MFLLHQMTQFVILKWLNLWKRKKETKRQRRSGKKRQRRSGKKDKRKKNQDPRQKKTKELGVAELSEEETSSPQKISQTTTKRRKSNA